MSGTRFDDLADVYEAMIDWPKRLANEEPFYRRWFCGAGVRRLLDVACGTGRHAAMFHSWGLRVEAADISPRIIERARAALGELEGLSWAVRGFDQPVAAEEPFDAALCVGNSLALAPDWPTVRRAVAAMFAAVRDGGLVILHILNLWRLPDGPCLWQKCTCATLQQGDALILKGVHRSGSRGYVDLVVTSLAGVPQMQSESVPFLGIEASDLLALARAAGASETHLFGSYQEQTYQRETSVDLILAARK